MKIKKWIGALLAAAVIAAGVQMPGEVRAESDIAGTENSEDSELESPEGFTEKKVVVLDPGHGGREAGAYAVHNGHVYREEEINWKISCYTMEELKKYPYIEVHLTRTKNQTKSLVSRVLTAKSYHADLLVSQHINDGGSPYPKGASVLISRGTYRPYLSEKEKLLGKYVMEELGKLGITKRYPSTGGMEYRLSEDGSRYPNGAIRDYYGIVAQSVEQNIPGVIIEHAFVTNASDATRYLRTNQQLKKLGQADARAIVRYLEKTSSQEEKKDTVKPNRKNGWKQKGNSYYYYIRGVVQKKRVLHLDDGTYYVGKTGKKYYGWKTINDSRYYFDKENDGKACIGWKEIAGTLYCFKASGELYRDTQLFTKSGKIYLFDAVGKRNSGWYTWHQNKYYIDENGCAHTSWLNLDGKWYYFDTKTGAMYKKCTVKTKSGETFTFNAKGVCTNRE